MLFGSKGMSFKERFMREMDAQGVKYADEGENRVRVSYRGDNTNDIRIVVIFDKDGDNDVALRCWSFGKVPDGKHVELLETCNTLNNRYRWLTFCIDQDEEIAVSMDALVDAETGGAECLQLVKRMVSIYDQAYPQLKRACWS